MYGERQHEVDDQAFLPQPVTGPSGHPYQQRRDGQVQQQPLGLHAPVEPQSEVSKRQRQHADRQYVMPVVVRRRDRHDEQEQAHAEVAGSVQPCADPHRRAHHGYAQSQQEREQCVANRSPLEVSKEAERAVEGPIVAADHMRCREPQQKKYGEGFGHRSSG